MAPRLPEPSSIAKQLASFCSTDRHCKPANAPPKLRTNILIVVLVSALIVVILLGWAGWKYVRSRISREYKEDLKLAQELERRPGNAYIPRYRKEGRIRPAKQEQVISRPGYVLVRDDDGHLVRRDGQLSHEILDFAQINDWQRQRQSQRKQKHDQKQKQRKNSPNKRGNQNSQNNHRIQKKNHQNIESSKSKKNEDNGSKVRSNTQNRQENQKEDDAWMVVLNKPNSLEGQKKNSRVNADGHKKTDSNHGNQENKEGGNFGNDKNDAQNRYDQDGFDQYGYDRNNLHRDGYEPDGYDRNGYDRNGYDRNGQYYAQNGGNWNVNANANERDNQKDNTIPNEELGPVDSISNSRFRYDNAGKPKSRQGLPPSDQGKRKSDKARSGRSNKLSEAMGSQIPMKDERPKW